MFVRHNELRNITAQLMEEVSFDVGIELSLQPISNEVLHYTKQPIQMTVPDSMLLLQTSRERSFEF